MLLSVLFAACVISTGFGVLNASGLRDKLVTLGLAPAAGLSVLILLTIWSSFVGLPVSFCGMLFVGGAALGAVMAVGHRNQWRRSLLLDNEFRLSVGMVGLATVIPAVVLGGAFAGVSVPVSSHDGAYHVELINRLRAGGHWDSWYPIGFHSIAAAFLQLFPGIDTAQGALGAGLGLAVLAPLGVFGLGLALLRRPAAAAIGSVLVGVTAQYPYHLQFWDGWPLGIGIILATALWTVAAHYLERPGLGLGLFGAILASSILLTHGTELYTAGIGLVFLAVASWRRVPWLLLARHLPVAVAIAGLLTLPYLQGLSGWAQASGAQAAGTADLAARPTAAIAMVGLGSTLQLIQDALGSVFLDVPVRAALVAAGVFWAFRARTARVVGWLALTFTGLALAFEVTDTPVLDQLYAVTFPWGQDYRLLMLSAICASVLGGAGMLSVACALRRRGTAVWRVGIIFGLVLAQVSLGLLEQRLSIESVHYVTFSADDEQAMTWLRQHLVPGDLVANDGSADAGIWAPYKAGATILIPRVLPVDHMDTRAHVRSEIGQLGRDPVAQSLACDLGVRYVYVGARGTVYEPRQFPSAAELRQTAMLDKVFSSGDAAVYAMRCP